MILHPGLSCENSCLPGWLPITAETNLPGHEYPSSSVTFPLVPSALKLRERRKQGQGRDPSMLHMFLLSGSRGGGGVPGSGGGGLWQGGLFVFSGLSVSNNDRERES